ncbi:DNA repair protein RecN [Kordiimonas sediminis]|uniref:DNA repair protein RecN n=1 Tax=Kordiimonas sediminis TaxID=1735581 RepID=A0A919AT97_9PROT|nr:DNA repair protein RecN [Kordiimonas sediminis]GHF21143.1 DNA repair protein RecN [Kordiimonas sediminis]
MLASLSIRDIVLIDKLTLNFEAGLTVLTGETGAGKSILLDSLGLATGSRADRALVRQGQDTGIVIAEFCVAPDHAACIILEEEGMDSGGGTLLLRRQVSSDGRSRAWINDQPVSQTMLSQVGSLLLEVHGQHDDRGLLEASAHRGLLDTYGAYETEAKTVSDLFRELEKTRKHLRSLEAEIEAARKDEEYLRHAVEELDLLGMTEGEEEALSEKRTMMMQGEKLSDDLSGFMKDLMKDKGIDAAVRNILRKMDRLDASAHELVKPVYDSLDRAAIELGEGIGALEGLMQDLEFNPVDLEETEERLFEIRRLARKHSCAPDDLVSLREQLHARIQALEAGDTDLSETRHKVEALEKALGDAVTVLHKKRVEAAAELDALVMAELPPLKLEKAIFRTVVTPVEPDEWTRHGGDFVTFEVQTNPGAPFGQMVKIASGGELARFILALKVVLARSSSTPVMVFDEVDRGIGGATADAVGERLKRLTDGSQVLVVTHSPQVAARGDSHFQIEKGDDGVVTRTAVRQLENIERREELARMLSGAEITDEARAAADRLLLVS